MATATRIKFGDYLNVTDEGGGVIRVDGCPPGGGTTGIQFDLTPQEGGFLEATTTSGSISLEATSDDLNLNSGENVNLIGDTGINLQANGGGGIILDAEGYGDIWLEARVNSGIDLVLHSPAKLKIIGLPTTDPGITNAVYIHGGFLKISGYGPTIPDAPTLDTAVPGSNVVTLGWTAPASDGGDAITNYAVYRGTSSGTWTLLTTLGVVFTHADTTAVNGTTYYYVVRAVNSIGEGPSSNELSATPASTVLDDFNRADGAIGSNWTQVNSLGGNPLVIGSNRAKSSTGGQTSSVWNVTSFGATQYAEATVGALDSAGAHMWMLLQAPTPASASYDGYLIDFDHGAGGAGTVTIYRAISNTYTNLGSTSFSFAVGNVMKAEKVGAVITIYKNGTSIHSVTDSSPLSAAGYAGLGMNGTTTSAWDDFSAA